MPERKPAIASTCLPITSRRGRPPSLFSVEAFVVTASCQSFRAAADALALSPSALTRRIQALEHCVGGRLFERGLQGIQLTARGKEYLAAVEPALDAIRSATYPQPSAEERALRIALSHSFASNWLMKRLSQLVRDTRVQVELKISRDPQLLRSQQVELAIWGGMSNLDDLPHELLFEVQGVIVSSDPTLMLDETNLLDIADHRLLSVANPANTWQRWLGPALDVRNLNVLQFETLQLAYEAAKCGLGLALAIPLLAESHLRDRHLHAVSTLRRPLDDAYNIHFASAQIERNAAVRRVCAWLHEEASRSCAEFDAWWEAQARGRESQRPRRASENQRINSSSVSRVA